MIHDIIKNKFRQWFPSRDAKILSQWRKDKEYIKPTDYKFTKDSVVFDVGGWKGNFAQDLVKRFDCFVEVFEPIKEFCDEMEAKFSGNRKVKVHNIGLSDFRGEKTIHFNGIGSSFYVNGNARTIAVDTLTSFVRKFDFVDLVKMNIEGEEYAVLDEFLKSDVRKRVKLFQVQFHNYGKDALKRLNELREKLSETHDKVYSYDFVWDCWRLR